MAIEYLNGTKKKKLTPEKLREILREHGQRLPHGYTLSPRVLAGLEEEYEMGDLKSLLNKVGGGLKKFGQNVVSVVKKAGKIGLTVTLAPVRVAFLGLVELNALGLGTKIQKAIQKDRGRVKKFWEDLGGDITKLESASTHGFNKPIPKPQAKHAINGVGEMGEPVTIATAVAAATPILIKVLPLLKDILGKDGELPAGDQQAVNQGIQEYKTTASDAASAQDAKNQLTKPFYKEPYFYIPASALVAFALYSAIKTKK